MQPFDLNQILSTDTITASAPCRVDMGGTLDIGTFFYPLRRFRPATVNLAIGLRTKITLSSHTPGRIKVSSRGFKSVDVDFDDAPFDHPLGLIFAIVSYFDIRGVHVRIDSASPPKSGLGGSSVAAVALVAALSRIEEMQGEKSRTRSEIALLAHAIEASVAMIPCGYQDQLAAVYGGIHAWQWHATFDRPFARRVLVKKEAYHQFERHLLVAYTGVPHVSSDINGEWLRQFLAGKYRKQWEEIISLSRRFAGALEKNDIRSAVDAMNAEVAIRRRLTPAVLDNMGNRLVAAAVDTNCGARFTGAGGGGCIWALGEVDRIRALKTTWKEILSTRPAGQLIKHSIDDKGVVVG